MGTRAGRKQINMFNFFCVPSALTLYAESTQKVRKSTQRYATVRHPYATLRNCTPSLRNTTLLYAIPTQHYATLRQSDHSTQVNADGECLYGFIWTVNHKNFLIGVSGWWNTVIVAVIFNVW